MSARDWQPGDKANVEVEVEDVTRMSGVDTAFVWVQSTRPGLGRSVGVRVPAADLLPVPQPDEDTIERAHKVVADKVWEIHGPDSTDMDSAEMDAEDIVAALAAANLLADPRTAEERFLGATYVEDLSPIHGGLDETVEVIQPGRSEAELGCGACVTCDPPNEFASRMYVCATCGNKRCPAAVDCREWECSGSNDPDQPRRRRAARVAGTTDTEGQD